jgi:hypothetical protein
LQKKFNNFTILIFITMHFITEFEFNIILRILITIYWTLGIWNLLARTADPRIDDDAEVFKLNKWNYVFWLVSSLLFFFFWISEFKNEILIYLSVIEIVVLIISYMYLIFHVQTQNSKQRKKINEINEKREDAINK